MKKIMLWVISIIVIIAALIGAGAGWAVASNHRIDLNRFSVSKLTQKTLTSTTTVRNLSLNVRTAVVEIKTGSQFTINATNVTNDELQLREVGDTVTVTQTQAGQHHFELGRSAKITITVPTQLTTLSANQLNGTLKLTDLNIDHLNLAHSNGTTQLTDVSLKAAGTLTKQNGSINLKRVTVPGLQVQLKNGQAHLNGQKISNHYTDHHAEQLMLTSNNGQVNVITK